MKTTLGILRVLIVLSSAFATTAAFGQTTYTWTGAGDGTNLVTAGNWNPFGLPGFLQDTARWDGLTTTNLVLSYGFPGFPTGEFGGAGIALVLTANQTNSVQIISPVVVSPNMAIDNITINGPGGQLELGGGNPANEIVILGRPAGAVHDWINNSTNPAVIDPNLGLQAGGGVVYTILFDGTGDWLVTNSLRSANNTGILLAKTGTGTWYWNGPTTLGLALQPNSPINSPLSLNGGKVVLQWNDTYINNVAIQNNGDLLEYDAPAQSQTLNGVISGTGAVLVNNGTLTLGGQNTHTGTNILSGGTLIVNSAENPDVSGPLGEPVTPGSIVFSGGTLRFSVNNTFDYSSRFSTVASQAYNFDTAGQNVTFATGLGSSGGTLVKSGYGTLALAGASTYSGNTTVSSGRLLFQGPKTGSGNITVADGAFVAVTAGTQVTPGTLTLGTSSGCTLEFNNVNSTTTALIAAGTLSSAGTITININSGTFTVGQTYPLLTWTSGSAPTVRLGTSSGSIGRLSILGNMLYLDNTSLVYAWTGAGDGTNLATAGNWNPNGLPSGATQDTAQWDGVTTSNLVINYGSTGLPGTGFGTLGVNFVLTANQTNSVQIISSVALSANMAINDITINGPGGALSLGDGSAHVPSIIMRPAGAVHDWVNNSTNPATIYPNVKWQAGGGATYTLVFDGAGNWNVTNNLVNDNVPALVAKLGSGTLTWAGPSIPGAQGDSSIYSPFAIGGGTVVLAWATTLLNNIAIQNNGDLLAYDAPAQSQTLNGVISGTGALQVNNGTLTLTANNTYTGTTTISNGTLLINGNNVAASTTVNAGTLGGIGTLSGPVTLATGTPLAPGASVGAVGTLTINNNLSIGGNLAIEVNKSLSPSNDFVVVVGGLTNTGTGTVTVSNLGPALVVGDKFMLFSKPAQNGAALTVTGAGVTWANHLAVDGSITVSSVSGPALNFTQTANSLQFSWTSAFGTFKLQAQTNSLSVGLNTNWADYPGGGASPVTVPMDATQGTVFFRLVSMP